MEKQDRETRTSDSASNPNWFQARTRTRYSFAHSSPVKECASVSRSVDTYVAMCVRSSRSSISYFLIRRPSSS